MSGPLRLAFALLAVSVATLAVVAGVQGAEVATDRARIQGEQAEITMLGTEVAALHHAVYAGP